MLMPNNPRGGGVSRRVEGEERGHDESVVEHLEDGGGEAGGGGLAAGGEHGQGHQAQVRKGGVDQDESGTADVGSQAGGFDVIYNMEIPIGLNFANLPKNATLTEN